VPLDGTVRLVRVSRFAGVVALHHDRVALVRQRWDEYGQDFWTIPSGAVEAGETPAGGAVRELAEETGLVVAVGRLRLVSTSSTTHGDARMLAWNFTTTIDEPELAVADPDGLILQAHWFSRTEAVRLLDQLPYRPLREPVLAHLTDGRTQAPGSGWHWRYDTPHATPVVTASTAG
jgi:8-oxo-dGTP diphosphatase